MSQLLLNEVFLSIYTRDGLYSLAYYSFNEDALFFKDKFSDNTLNFENVLALVKQLKPTFCLLNLNSKVELYNHLTDTLSELFITNRLDDYDNETVSTYSSENEKFTSIKSVGGGSLFQKADSVNRQPYFATLNNQNKTKGNQKKDDNQSASNQLGSLQNNLITTTVENKNSRVLLLSNKFYNLDQCRKAIFECDYHEEKIFTENDKRIFISSLLNLSDEFLVKSIGALLIYINQNRLGMNNGKGLSVQKVDRFKCENYVNIDQVTLNELQVFSFKDHPSIFKKDVFKKSDTSLFSLFNKCRSNYGTNYLRKLFFQPLNSYDKLNSRLDDIEQMMCLTKDVTYFFNKCLKKIKSINAIVEKMKIAVLSLKQFLLLANTVENLIAIHQHVLIQTTDLHIYTKIKKHYTVDLEKIINDIRVVINLEKSDEDKKIEINPGVNEELDKMKLEFENIEEILLIATEHEKNSSLSDFITNFQIIFSPIFGFVIQVFHSDLKNNEKKMLLTLKDVEYISTTDKFKYFKTKNLKKYDESYSDLLTEISCKQNAILLDLQNGILNRFPKVFAFLEVIGEFDCLLRFAEIAKLYNYVRPTFNFANKIEIRNGRHPLKEISENAFIANDYVSEHPKSIKIITGANNAGKTIYLKQNCLLIYMAYLGSFVPADHCDIPLFSKILTKIETIESMSTCLSSFTNDLCRLSSIISKIPYNSLVVVDEFGKGTNFEDGLSIFSAYINYIIEENPKSHFIISTHIHSLPDFLTKSDHISYQQLEVKFENDEIFYTYNLIDGLAEFSFPLELGKKIKFDPQILERANEIRELSKKGDSSFKEMVAYSASELEKSNIILEQVSFLHTIIELNISNDEEEDSRSEMDCNDE